MKSAGGNHYYQQIKRLHSAWNCNKDKRAGYDRKFESTSAVFCHDVKQVL